METKIRLCDTCKKKVKEHTCDFCGDDMCDGCSCSANLEIGATYGTGNFKVVNFVYCENCKKHFGLLYKSKEMQTDFLECLSNFKGDFIKAFIKVVMVKKLNDNGEDNE